MDEENFKAKVDERCKIVDSAIANIDKTIHGAILREKMFELTNHMALFNDHTDKLSLKVGLQKRKVELIESIAMQAIDLDEKLQKKAVSIKESYIENYDIELDGGKTTLNKEKVELEYLQYGLARCKSTFEALKITIMVCQSALSFDRAEMQNLNIS